MTLRERAEQLARSRCRPGNEDVIAAYESGWTAALKEAASCCRHQTEMNDKIAAARMDKAKDKTDRDMACIHRTMAAAYHHAADAIRKLAEAK